MRRLLIAIFVFIGALLGSIYFVYTHLHTAQIPSLHLGEPYVFSFITTTSWDEYKPYIFSLILVGIFWQWLFKNLLKVGIKIVIAGVVAFCIWGLLGDWTVNSVDKFHRIMESKKQLYPKPVPVVQERTVYWSHRNTDGTIPVGVWSEAIGVPTGCSMHIPDDEIDSVYNVKYRIGTKWYNLHPYQKFDFEEIKIQMTVSGVKEMTFKSKC